MTGKDNGDGNGVSSAKMRRETGREKNAFTLEEVLAIRSLRGDEKPLTKSQMEAFTQMVNLSRRDRRMVMDMIVLFGLVERDHDKATIIRRLVGEAA